MGVAVPAEDPPCARRVHPGQPCRRHQQQSAQPGGHKARNIVQARRRRAKILIPLIFIAQHGIHGVDGLIDHAADGPAQRQVKERRNNAVCSVLRHCLHRRANDALPVQAFRVAPHDHGDRAARLVQAPAVPRQRVIYFHRRIPQVSRRQRVAAQDRFYNDAGHRAAAVQHFQDSPRNLKRHRYHKSGQHKTLDPMHLRGVLLPVPELFQRRDQSAHQAHRVRHPLRVPDQAVQTGPCQNTDQPVPYHKISSPCLLVSSSLISFR